MKPCVMLIHAILFSSALYIEPLGHELQCSKFLSSNTMRHYHFVGLQFEVNSNQQKYLLCFNQFFFFCLNKYQVNKVDIQYDKVAKQVDVHLLKEEVWNQIQDSMEKSETVSPLFFFQLRGHANFCIIYFSVNLNEWKMCCVVQFKLYRTLLSNISCSFSDYITFQKGLNNNT